MAEKDRLLDQEELDFLLRGTKPSRGPACDQAGQTQPPEASGHALGQDDPGADTAREPSLSAPAGRPAGDGPRSGPSAGLARALLRFCHALGEDLAGRAGTFACVAPAGCRVMPWRDARTMVVPGPAILMDLAAFDGRFLLCLPAREARALMEAALGAPADAPANTGMEGTPLAAAELAALDTLLAGAARVLSRAFDPACLMARARPARPALTCLYVAGEDEAVLLVEGRLEMAASWGRLFLVLPARDMERLDRELASMPHVFGG